MPSIRVSSYCYHFLFVELCTFFCDFLILDFGTHHHIIWTTLQIIMCNSASQDSSTSSGFFDDDPKQSWRLTTRVEFQWNINRYLLTKWLNDIEYKALNSPVFGSHQHQIYFQLHLDFDPSLSEYYLIKLELVSGGVATNDVIDYTDEQQSTNQGVDVIKVQYQLKIAEQCVCSCMYFQVYKHCWKIILYKTYNFCQF